MLPELLERRLTFRIDQDDRVKINDWECRLLMKTDTTVTFCAVGHAERMQTYEIGHLNRLNGEGKIQVDLDYFLPEELRCTANGPNSEPLQALTDEQQEAISGRYAMVRAFEELVDAGQLKRVDDVITANMELICRTARKYMRKEIPEPEEALRITRAETGEGRKMRSRGVVEQPDEVSARQLRHWASRYKHYGHAGLLDRKAKQGNRTSYYSPEENRLLLECIEKDFLKLKGPNVTQFIKLVQIEFAKENARRVKLQLPQLRVPGKKKVRKTINSLDAFRVAVKRLGHKKAMARFAAVGAGAHYARPFERVEIDEWKIDLFTIAKETGLFDLFSEEELEAIGLLDRTKRWWLVGAIDCRTRCIVALTLTCTPCAGAALDGLKQVVSDKTDLARASGAQTPWNMFGTPETLWTDNGPAFIPKDFTQPCGDLRITSVKTIAGEPSMRALIERIFRTMATSLIVHLDGRTMSNPQERGDYESEKAACLSVDDLCSLLVRWCVDIHHTTPQPELGGLTPLQQWEKDIADGNHPLKPAPTMKHKRCGLGERLTRKLQRTGVVVLGIHYHSEVLSEAMLKHGSHDLQVRWLPDDIGAVEVSVDGEWHTVHAVHRGFDGVHAQLWITAMRALKRKYPERRAHDARVALKALDEIRALNADRRMDFKMVHKPYTPKHMEALEAEAIAIHVPEDTGPRPDDAADRGGIGTAITPEAPERPTEAKTKIAETPRKTPAKGVWKPR
jgi:putative transposase